MKEGGEGWNIGMMECRDAIHRVSISDVSMFPGDVINRVSTCIIYHSRSYLTTPYRQQTSRVCHA
jgi:hypothetical protein